MNLLKNIKYEHKLFILFLLIHLLVWTGVGMIRTVLPTDALEGIYWGSLHDFGTPKHPPLAGWITYLVYSLFKSDFSIYFVSQLFITVGFIYIYKIARLFLDEKKSVCSVMLLEGCWVYGYITGYYGFNPDVILLMLLPMVTYVFLKCMENDKPIDWIKLGVLVGISFMNKYQTVLVLTAMIIWAIIYKREVFKNKCFYISVIIAFLIFLPHLLWLIKYDFFPLLYFEGEFEDNTFIKHITAPFIFLLVQLSLIIGSLLIYGLLKLKQKSEFKLTNVTNNPQSVFLALFIFVPLIIHLLMGAFGGGTMRPRWGFEFWYLTGIALFYFCPTKELSKDDIKYVFKSALGVMLIIFLSLGTLLAVEKNYRSRYNVPQVYGDMKQAWKNQIGTDLKYFGGYIEWTLPLTIYGKDHEQIILDTNGYRNIWINEDDLRKSGILILDRTPEKVEIQLRKSCPYLDENYQVNPVEYKFTIWNALGQPREYTIYYHIVKPEI